MKDKKRRFELYSYYDRTGIAHHLEKLSEKGWILAVESAQMQIFYNEQECGNMLLAVEKINFNGTRKYCIKI